MSILQQLTKLVTDQPKTSDPQMTYRVALGALLTLVAGADGLVTDQERAAKRMILAQRGFTDPEEQRQILTAGKQALETQLDWHGFTWEINQTFTYPDRVRLVQDLFRVAWADSELAHDEVETIRKIAALMWVDHKDFIQAKLDAKIQALNQQDSKHTS
ncbi:MAG: TerB family tellurite resistance protein [candidate division FCPU426 bacterium]